MMNPTNLIKRYQHWNCEAIECTWHGDNTTAKSIIFHAIKNLQTTMSSSHWSSTNPDSASIDSSCYLASAIDSTTLDPDMASMNDENHVHGFAVYNSFFVWQLGTKEDLPPFTKEYDTILQYGRCKLMMDELSIVFVYNLALLHHRQAIQENESRQYQVAMNLYNIALHIYRTKISRVVAEHHHPIRCHTSSDHHHESKFKLIHAAILNNLIHIYQFLYRIEEVRTTMKFLQLILHDDPIISDHRGHPILKPCSNHNHNSLWITTKLLSDDDHDFFQLNLFCMQHYDYQTAPVA